MTIFHDVDVEGKVRDAERLISYNKNIASLLPDICEARCEYKGNGAQNTNSNRTIAHPKRGFSNGQTAEVYCDRNGQYDGNRSRRLNTHHDDEIEMTKNVKKKISQAGRGLALAKDVEISNVQRSYEILRRPYYWFCDK